jgi:hypothetical protein
MIVHTEYADIAMSGSPMRTFVAAPPRSKVRQCGGRTVVPCAVRLQFEWESKSRALPVYFVDVNMRGHVLLK